jgi:beta-glucanase (GH16 family)
VNDFTTSSRPAGWYVFTGIPGGDPGAHFGGSHVVFGDGLLRLNTYRDPSWHDRWVTGGICQCGLSQTYGAYFVRSRVTAAGPNEAELLWPTAGTWPPEIDFNESGAIDSGTSSSIHSGASNHIDHRWLRINLTAWHTWGVIWNPESVIYTVDGQVWSSVAVASEIPRRPMTLDLEQRTKCSVGTQCPTRPVSMQVDWVAEYTESPPNPATSVATTTTTTTSPSTPHLIAHA